MYSRGKKKINYGGKQVNMVDMVDIVLLRSLESRIIGFFRYSIQKQPKIVQFHQVIIKRYAEALQLSFQCIEICVFIEPKLSSLHDRKVVGHYLFFVRHILKQVRLYLILHSFYLMIQYTKNFLIGQIISLLDIQTYRFVLFYIIFKNDLLAHRAISKYNGDFIVSFVYCSSFKKIILFIDFIRHSRKRRDILGALGFSIFKADLGLVLVSYFFSVSSLQPQQFAFIRILFLSFLLVQSIDRDSIVVIPLKTLSQTHQFSFSRRQFRSLGHLSHIQAIFNAMKLLIIYWNISQSIKLLDRVFYIIFLVNFEDVSVDNVVIEFKEVGVVLLMGCLYGVWMVGDKETVKNVFL